MEQRLGQADWTTGESSPDTKEKEQAINKLATQVEEQVTNDFYYYYYYSSRNCKI